jgi:hypothetical protein
MPVQATRRRVTTSKPPSTAPVRKRRQAARKPKATLANTDANAGLLFVAQFAEALGQKPVRKSPRKGVSLSRALLDAAGSTPDGHDAIGAMLGVRLPATPARRATVPTGADDPVPPCEAVHSRNRWRRLLRSAGGWSVALAVSALIVAIAGAGLTARAPAGSALATASVAQL